MAQRTKVAILGGGAAGATAACALTATRELSERYQGDALQIGWRMGGKGASGRNGAVAQRIEEHGLHIWLGFYDNAFALMRRVYEELDRSAGAPLATWRNASIPCDTLVLSERWRGAWVGHQVCCPRNELTPGDERPHGFWTVVERAAAALLGRWLHNFQELPRSSGATPCPCPRGPRASRPSSSSKLVAGRRLLPTACSNSPTWSPVVPTSKPVTVHRSSLVSSVRSAIGFGPTDTAAERLDHNGVRFLFVLADLVASTLSGIVEDELLERGFGAVDDEELRAWLARHGAHELTLNGPVVRGLYDLDFAFEEGDVTRPNIAAGKALQAMIRIGFFYKGAILWKMQAGMGDTIFAPF